ncbi:8-oxo-dGTP diphosphatase [Dysgonomonas sp. PH5-45]|uniref:NUDIX hydrolase n=1 Tax=unclassified Dysgonomonas TaxID=2630389 RepID=UPI002476F9B7|nr:MULTISPECIES: DNA mismatch repair protein MutT [unclassified Dysgonomonas]MDH6355009.1 8-oxo-dGTP diphosphatase [Dysgonomonas sp. PH5-45]MDH6387866.1 8-oxo-dGTP diphosphatase [Dysgonomonas sp. PH5-37]
MRSLTLEKQERFYVVADCVILGFKNGKIFVLIAKSDIDTLKDMDSLPNVFLMSNKGLTETVVQLVQKYTGIENTYICQAKVYDKTLQSDYQVVTVAFFALINMQEFDQQLLTMHNTRWVELSCAKNLIIDQDQILKETVAFMQKKAAAEPIAFSLLPKRFTLPQVQNLYEALFRMTFDKRNFRKKILDMNILDKFDEKDRVGSKKGAFLYKFNEDKFQRFLKKKHIFSLR